MVSEGSTWRQLGTGRGEGNQKAVMGGNQARGRGPGGQKAIMGSG